MQVNTLFDVSGRHAVVTGGSRGIGAMITEGLLRGGVEVIISSRKQDELAATAAALSALGTVHAVAADLSTEDGIGLLTEAVTARWGTSLDILVNNAGAVWGAPIDEFPADAFDKVLGINVKAPFLLTQALLPHLRAAATEGHPARVINIGSIDGIRVPQMDNFSYSASKAAIHQLTRHLAQTLAAANITVNAIAPGPFASKMTAFALATPEARAAVADHVPMGRIGTPEDVAGTVIYLASRAGAYLTGAVIPVDGGISNR
ncbi:MAG: NAD(P)-dependent dehydrogenase (short-subunit alcohol dehydrogenase family) [Nitriliruptoraceae bacterium]|jgi:NAD(P)-dependent dehydrogenase (short-subunit alcohol dehydrogenase family)